MEPIWIGKDTILFGLLDDGNRHIYATYQGVKKRNGTANTFQVENFPPEKPNG